MVGLGWDARFNRPAAKPSQEASCADPPDIEAVLGQLQRWQNAVQAETKAESDRPCESRSIGNTAGGSKERTPGVEATKEEKRTPTIDDDGSDGDMAAIAAMMAAAID